MKNRHLTLENSNLQKLQLKNEELERQNAILKNSVAKTKSNVKSLNFERTQLIEMDRRVREEEVTQMREAD